MAGKEFFVNPLKRKNRGLRSGRPVLKSGKVINRDKDGYEVIDDYFSESDAESSLSLHRSSVESHKFTKDVEDNRIIQSQPAPSSRMSTRNRNTSSYRSVVSSVNSKVSSSTSSYNPVGWLHNKNYGRRTGLDIKAGKNIRKRPDGFEVFEDYWSESDADSLMISRHSTCDTPEVTSELHRSSIQAKHAKVIEDDRIVQSQPAPVSHMSTRNRNTSSYRSVASSVNSKVSNSSYNPVGWLHNKNYGRRTGKDIKAGKVIRKGPDGFEVFDDYWSESEADSLMLSRINDKTIETPIVPSKDFKHNQDSESDMNPETTESEGSTLQSDLSDGSSKDDTYCAKEDSRIAEFLPQLPDDSPTKTGLQRKTLSVLTEKSQTSQLVSPEKILNKSKRKSLSSGKNNLSNESDLSVNHKSREDDALSDKDNSSLDGDEHSSLEKENLTPESCEHSSLSTEHLSEHSSPGKENVMPELSEQSSLSTRNLSEHSSLGMENSSSESNRGLTSGSKSHLSVSEKSVNGQQNDETSDTEIHHSSHVKEVSNDLSDKEGDQELPECDDQGHKNQELLNSRHESQELSSDGGENYQESLSRQTMLQSSLLKQQGESLQNNLQNLRSEVTCNDHSNATDMRSYKSVESFGKQDTSECQDHTKVLTGSENTTSSRKKSIRHYDIPPGPLIPSSLADKLLNKSNKKELEVSTNRTDNRISLPESSLSGDTTHHTESRTSSVIPHAEINDNTLKNETYTEHRNKTHNTTTHKSFVFPDLSFDSQDSVMMVDDDNDSVENKSLKQKSMRKGTKSMITVDNSVLDESVVGKTYRKSTGSMMTGKNNKQKQGKKSKQTQLLKGTAENVESTKNSTNTEVSNTSSSKKELSLNDSNENLKINKQLKVTKRSKGKWTNHSVTNTDTSLQLNDSHENLKKDKQSKAVERSKDKSTNHSVTNTDTSLQLNDSHENLKKDEQSKAVERSKDKSTNHSVTNTDIHDCSTEGIVETNKEDSKVKTKTTKRKKGKKAVSENKKYILRSVRKSVGNKSSDVTTNESENTLNEVTEDIHFPSEESMEAERETNQRKLQIPDTMKITAEEDDLSHDENFLTNNSKVEDDMPDEKQENISSTVTKVLIDKSQATGNKTHRISQATVDKTHGISQFLQVENKTVGISQLSQATSIVIGGNKTGSLTKVESDPNLVGSTPCFRTRKRLSYSIAALDSSQLQGKKKRQPRLSSRENSIIYDQLLNKRTFVLDTDSDESSQFLFNKTQTNKSKVERNDAELLEGDWNSHNDKDMEAQKSKSIRKKGVHKEKHISNPTVKKNEAKKKKKGGKNKPQKKSSTKESSIEESIHRKEIDLISKHRLDTVVYNNQREESDINNKHQVEMDNTHADNKHVEDTDVDNKHVEDTDVDNKHVEDTDVDNKHVEDTDVDNKHPEETDEVNKYQELAVLDNEHEEKEDFDNIHQEEAVVDTYPHGGEDNSNIDNNNTHISAGSEIEKEKDINSSKLSETNKLSNNIELRQNRRKTNRRKTTGNSPVKTNKRRNTRKSAPVISIDVKEEENLKENIRGKKEKEKIISKRNKKSFVFDSTETSLADEQEIRDVSPVTSDQPTQEHAELEQDGIPVTGNQPVQLQKHIEEQPLSDANQNEMSDLQTFEEDNEISTRVSSTEDDMPGKTTQDKRRKKEKNKGKDVKKTSPVTRKRSIPNEIITDEATTPVIKQHIMITNTPDVQYPVSLLKEGLKSGVSFRSKRRTIVVEDTDTPQQDTSNKNITDNDMSGLDVDNGQPDADNDPDSSGPHIVNKDEADIDGKIPNIIRRRSSMRFAPPTDIINTTPCIVKGKGSKSKERRVTISRKVIETSFDVENTTGSSTDHTQNMTDGPLVHAFEMTSSQTPEKIGNPKLNKMISPEPAPEGVRRSRRTRLKRLDNYKLEIPIYERRKSGGFAIIGIKPSVSEAKLKAMELKRKNQLKVRKKPDRRLSRRLSAHAELPSEVDPTINTEITVYNPDNEEDVMLECIGTKEQSLKFGPDGEEACDSDPFFMTRSINQPAFGTGMLQLNGLMEKPLQAVTKGTVIFHIIFGKLLVTIQSTSVILSTHDQFFVPRGNTYSIKNLRKDVAKLSYVMLKEDEPEDQSD
ncbi:uncharacterized protein PF3D7_1120600-like isoform X2 [Mytilus californianus]|uniref:uncharacterized protein PF3D7_1120600-like isoform X2 n=1 Tax=Mytilus californianus TaxID=6549 RepID=UPI00224555E8|nr:uncharacterized protein PF3D7_1120600-like isoform X2 [Mytilus californianus]